MITKRITIDGETNGIIVKTKVTITNKKSRYITLQDKVTPRLFNNLEVAKNSASIIMPDRRVEYYIKLGNNILIDIDSCNKVGNEWQFIHDNTLYIIKEKNSRRTMRLGYICFYNGDTERCDKEFGIKAQKELIEIIKSELVSLICENIDGGIVSVNKNGKEYIVNLKNTTSKIHIMYGSKLMDFNQAQKAEGKRCLPFIKEMDKYLTFYVYSDRDKTESLRLNGIEKSDKILEYIVSDIKNGYPDLNVKYVPVEYSGYVGLED